MKAIPVSAALLALLAGCASYGPGGVAPGQSEGDVVRRMGQPTERLQRPEGATRLEYARGPMGHHTYMVDLDGSGRVVAVEQVLDEAHFARVKPGDDGESVRQVLGRPSVVSGALGRREIWSYRYDNPMCVWFVVTLTSEGRVQSTGHPSDPACSSEPAESRALP